MVIFNKWVQDQVIKVLKISKQPTAEEQKDPKYCRYHRYVNPGADVVYDQPTLKFEKKKKLVGIYKFKKYRFVKMSTLIFVSNPYLRLNIKKKLKKINISTIISNTLNNPKL